MNHETFASPDPVETPAAAEPASAGEAADPWANLGELDFTSADMNCRFYLDEIKRLGRAEQISDFVHEALHRRAATYQTAEDFYAANPGYEEKVASTLTPEMQSALKEYSGYNFSWINNIERGVWDYEKMGRRTPELEARYRATADLMDEAIHAAPSPQEDFITFRGTSLAAFRGHKITSLADLTKMRGKFMLEDGFMSTALSREASFAGHEVNTLWTSGVDIEIHYHIPRESRDAVALLSDDLSYSPQQTEILVNHHTLNYISDVQFDDQGRAVIDMLMIPNHLYDYPEE